MKPTNLTNGKVVVTIPVEVKKELHHRAIDAGMTLNSYLAKILIQAATGGKNDNGISDRDGSFCH